MVQPHNAAEIALVLTQECGVERQQNLMNPLVVRAFEHRSGKQLAQVFDQAFLG